MVRICFLDFWPGYKNEFNTLFFLRYFTTNPKFQIVEDPNNVDLIICSVFGREHTKYNNVPKLLWSGENIAPWLDYGKSVSFEGVKWALLTNSKEMTLCPSSVIYKYIPYGGIHYDMNQIRAWREKYKNKPKTKFCCFVSGNSGSNREGYQIRENFFHYLSYYKKVDSSGMVLNNTGYLAPRGEAFIEWISSYKFMICMENSMGDSYITEKLFQAYAGGAIPIYWCDSSCYELFNTNSAVMFNTLTDTLNKVVEIDNNKGLYDKIMSEDLFNEKSAVFERSNIEKTLDEIISQV